MSVVPGDSGQSDSLELGEMLDRLPSELSRQAFMHASWVEGRHESYERLAFLGDSVLGLAVSADLFPRFSDYSAGSLTKLRAQVVSGRSCARVALGLGVPDRMRAVAPAELGRSVGALISTERVLASVVEAIIGACYLAFGFDPVAGAVVRTFRGEIEFALENVIDFKSSLQEYLAQRGKLVTYRVIEEIGPPHDRHFRSVARVDGAIIGRGDGRSKKQSEQEAARAALESLETSDERQGAEQST